MGLYKSVRLFNDVLISGAGTMGIRSSVENTGKKENGHQKIMNKIFILVFTFLGLMTVLSLYMLVVVL